MEYYSAMKEKTADRYTNMSEFWKHYANTENCKILFKKLNIYINGKTASACESEEFYC